MDHTYWHKQADKPLFPDLLWSRPENRAYAGKLGIIGGNAHGFAKAAEAYSHAGWAGAGSVRVLLPDSLQKTVGRIFEAGEYAPSTPSGSFGKAALASMLELANWADGLLLAGDLGHNSETAIVLESLLQNYHGQLTLVNDALDYSLATSTLQRENTLILPTLAQLQKLTANKVPKAFTSNQGLVQFVENLQRLTERLSCHIVMNYESNVVVAVNGQISTTKGEQAEIIAAAHAAVWWLQNPSKPFEALTTSIYKDEA